MINIGAKFLKLTNKAGFKNLNYLCQTGFSNLQVKIEYCRGCDNKEMFTIVESELYNEYRRTFGEHKIVIEANKSNEFDKRFCVLLKVDDKESERVWDNRKQGDIDELTVKQLIEIINKKIEESKKK